MMNWSSDSESSSYDHAGPVGAESPDRSFGSSGFDSDGAFVNFTPGSAVGIVGRRHVAVVDSDVHSELVESLTQMIGDESEFDAVTSSLVDRGLGNLPSLVFVQFGPTGIQSIVRGTVTLTVHSSVGEPDVFVDASKVHTWVEHAHEGVEAVTLQVPGAPVVATLGSVTGFRTLGGVVPVGSLAVAADRGLGALPAYGGHLGDASEDPRTDQSDTSDLSLTPPVFGPAVDVTPADDDADEVFPSDDENVVAEADLGLTPEIEPVDDQEPADDPTPEQANDELATAADNDPEVVGLTASFSDEARTWAPSPDNDGSWAESFDAPVDASGGAELEESVPADAPGVGEVTDAALALSAAAAPGTAGSIADDDLDGDDGLDDYDHLFGATQFRPVSEAGIDVDDLDSDDPHGHAHSAGSTSPPVISGALADASALSGDGLGDHDGLTISLDQLRAQVAAEAGQSQGSVDEHSSTGPTGVPMVHAVSCPAGHQNPPSAASCRTCGVEIPDQPHLSVPRPVLGTLRFSNGDERLLDSNMILGRSPKVQGRVEGTLPKLVQLESITKELSGTHLEVRIEGWQVMVIDRNSTNGTTVCLPNAEPQRLHPGEPTPIVPGTMVNMADEVRFTYEVHQ